ncbi:MAG: hypothetical protein KJ941_09310, partial [Bacteroidetes bacterium]|nr:hypothetical protein [Bacteroidota bacterium]
SKDAVTLKKWKIQAEELRKMSHQYKRNFGKDERDQRNLLRKEVQRIRKDIRDFCNQVETSWIEKAHVILGTPVGIADLNLDYFHFDHLIIDEGSQLLEPLFWGILPFAKQVVIAGDPFQLPPTLLSQNAQKGALGLSIMERAFKNKVDHSLLNIQYRMPPELIHFSNKEFYDNQLISHIESSEGALCFYDTTGTEAEEQAGESGSLCNPIEVEFIAKIIQNLNLHSISTTIISPYSAQVDLLKSQFPDFKISTIDSFQGQENDVIIFSTVRSNSDGNLGFLKDYRRMNVGLTRAKKKMIVIGDSATLGSDLFFTRFMENVEQLNGYHSCYELI